MSDDLLRELGSELPWDRPDADRREAVRSSLIVAARKASGGTARRRWLFIAGGFATGALAAAAVALVVIGDRGATEHHATDVAQAQITPSANAELEHTMTQTSQGVDEKIRVRTGSVHVAIPAVKVGDRVRIVTADAEIEGAGAFAVAVHDDSLTRVEVERGSARVIIGSGREQRAVFLAAGQTWMPEVKVATMDLVPPPAPAPAPVPAPVVHAPARVVAPDPVRTETPAPAKLADPDFDAMEVTTSAQPVTHPPAKQTTPSETERRFQIGWGLLRAGKHREAAAELQAAADANPDDALAADARYFQAVALVRANDARIAERVLVEFLDHARTSLRRGRAAVLLGRLLVDRGELASGRAWLQSAASDADPAVAKAARAHLASLLPTKP